MVANRDVVAAVGERFAPWLTQMFNSPLWGSEDFAASHGLHQCLNAAQPTPSKRTLTFRNMRQLCRECAQATLGVNLLRSECNLLLEYIEEHFVANNIADYSKDGFSLSAQATNDGQWALPSSLEKQDRPAWNWCVCDSITMLFEAKNIYKSKRYALDAMHEANRDRRAMPIGNRTPRVTIRRTLISP